MRIFPHFIKLGIHSTEPSRIKPEKFRDGHKDRDGYHDNRYGFHKATHNQKYHLHGDEHHQGSKRKPH
jgi:hypothetical protein